jgi:hypothetical protein
MAVVLENWSVVSEDVLDADTAGLSAKFSDYLE